ncbi:hypothetical protein OOT00_10055 [Desulfobotulus sp. H1]|uniref:Deacetylase sirtuin-type domain-containing protein n=1 Tax=Desulfobotulus pelophilus TaxID=2823377 RepID=A0ABT3NA34_9BACT|nr:hypothetical protein [Desulfobotulus pelophilus]MCW7754328.1 hypothetical protein [Desulfobotulus pelophilus]
MPTLPQLDVKTNSNHSPHVAILGAGASLAALPDGDKNGRKLPLMNNLVEVVGLESLFEEYGLKYEGENFEATYDALVFSGEYPDLVKEIELAVENYFSEMQLPDEATLYDYLVLGLRGKDIIATFNWDPFLAQAFQRNMNVIGYEEMPQMAFLHGNVAIGVCYSCKTKGWRFNSCDKCGNQFEPSKLLYPVSQKNYSEDEFICSEWENLQNHIKHAYFITVFGYSAPVTDAEARKLMLYVWAENTTRDLAQIDLVDIKPREAVKDSWKDFIVRENYAIQADFFNTYLSIHPRRSCDAFAMATLQQRPWTDNNFPKGLSLKQLQEWVKPLVDEEKNGHLSGKPCGEGK